MKKHYHLDKKEIKIIPKIIIVHWTEINSADVSFKRFFNSTLSSNRPDIIKASALNVSTHFLVDQNGTIFRLMPENFMARHVIGLNYSAIGIENVGGAQSIDNLTKAQLKANIELIHYLKDKYKSINYLIGHYEYTLMENNPLWLEADKGYRTIKSDPSVDFMTKVRANFPTLLDATK